MGLNRAWDFEEDSLHHRRPEALRGARRAAAAAGITARLRCCGGSRHACRSGGAVGEKTGLWPQSIEQHAKEGKGRLCGAMHRLSVCVHCDDSITLKPSEGKSLGGDFEIVNSNTVLMDFFVGAVGVSRRRV